VSEKIGAVVLAAGGGARFEDKTHKLLTTLRGEPLVLWALASAAAAGLDELIVVTGALEIDASWLPPGAHVALNERWAQGQATSLQTAVDAARQLGCTVVVVGLGDQPFVPAAAWQAVAASDSPIAVATYDGQRGNPVRLAAEVWPLLPISGDQGARALMANRPELVAEIPCPGNPSDIDTLEDLARWNS
jgi:molybdenum cofactor cytidylyltransferase